MTGDESSQLDAIVVMLRQLTEDFASSKRAVLSLQARDVDIEERLSHIEDHQRHHEFEYEITIRASGKRELQNVRLEYAGEEPK